MNELNTYEVKYFEHSNCFYVRTSYLKGFSKNHITKQLKRKYKYAIVCSIKQI